MRCVRAPNSAFYTPFRSHIGRAGAAAFPRRRAAITRSVASLRSSWAASRYQFAAIKTQQGPICLRYYFLSECARAHIIKRTPDPRAWTAVHLRRDGVYRLITSFVRSSSSATRAPMRLRYREADHGFPKAFGSARRLLIISRSSTTAYYARSRRAGDSSRTPIRLRRARAGRWKTKRHSRRACTGAHGFVAPSKQLTSSSKAGDLRRAFAGQLTHERARGTLYSGCTRRRVDALGAVIDQA